MMLRRKRYSFKLWNHSVVSENSSKPSKYLVAQQQRDTQSRISKLLPPLPLDRLRKTRRRCTLWILAHTSYVVLSRTIAAFLIFALIAVFWLNASFWNTLIVHQVECLNPSMVGRVKSLVLRVVGIHYPCISHQIIAPFKYWFSVYGPMNKLCIIQAIVF